MKKIFKLAAILLVMVGLSACGHWHKSPEDKANWVVKKISSELDLTDTQKAELEKMKKEYLQKRKDLNIGITQDQKNEIVTQIKSAKIDEPKMDKMFEERAKSRQLLMQFLNKKFYEFHAILTPEQRKKLAERVEKLMKKFHHEIE
jgi:Spy/CpxP family protein refolding chaperone